MTNQDITPKTYSNPIYSIGHSNRTIDVFVALLKQHDIKALVDIRTIPKSRHNPHYNEDALRESLIKEDIVYYRIKDLGGLRKARKDSPNAGWKNEGFRGYADYMQTLPFAMALAELITLSVPQRTAMMCAEAVPWRCHRSLVADALHVRGVPVLHIMSDGAFPHKLTEFAAVKGTIITYPPDGDLFGK